MDRHRKKPGAGLALTLAAGAAASVGLGIMLRRKPAPPLAVPPLVDAPPGTPQIEPGARAARVAVAGSGIALDTPGTGVAASPGIDGQWRNYRAGFKNGLYYRFGGSWLKPPAGESGFEPFYQQGENDGRVARRPRIDDPETIAAWEDALGRPAVGEPGGPPQMYS